MFFVIFFFFKQKTAYEMRISDWSSDGALPISEASVATGVRAAIGAHTQAQDAGSTDDVVALYTKDGVLELPGADPIEGHDAIRAAFQGWAPTQQIGRAACRGRVCQYV